MALFSQIALHDGYFCRVSLVIDTSPIQPDTSLAALAGGCVETLGNFGRHGLDSEILAAHFGFARWNSE